MASANALQEVQSFYLAYYGRPADPSGLTYWADRVDAEGGLDSLVDAFGTSAEATELLANKTTTEKINAIYQSLFGRDSDAEGLAFYSAEIEAGRITLQTLARDVFGGAQDSVTNQDATVLANKLQVATAFTNELIADPEAAAEYVGIAATTGAKAIITSVDATAASVTAAVAQVNVVLGVTTSTLTTGVDTIAGTAGRDKISGSNSTLSGSTTLNAADQIDGGEGNDSLTIELPSAWTGFSTGFVKNVETITLNHVGATSVNFNAKGIEGVSTLSLVTPDAGGLVTVTNAPTGLKTLSVTGAKGASGSGDTNLTLAYLATAAEVTGSNDTLAISLSGVGTNAKSASRQTPDQLNVNPSSIENFDVTVDGTNVASFGIGGTTLKTIKVSGSGSLAMHDVPTSLTSFDASAATGVMNVRFEDLTTATLGTIKTGSADDRITLQRDDMKVAGVIDGGAGADTLIVDSTTTAGILAATISGVETLAMNYIRSATTVSGANVSDVTTINLNSSDVNGESANTNGVGAAVTFQGMGAKNLTLNALGAVANHTITSDHSGSTVLNYTANSSAAKALTNDETTLADFALGSTTGLTVNVGAGMTTTGSTITANKAKSVEVNVTSGKTSAGVELSRFNSVLTANDATSITFNSAAPVAATTNDTDAAVADHIVSSGVKSLTINLTASTTSVDSDIQIEAPLLETLTVVTSMDLTITEDDDDGTTGDSGWESLQNVTATINAGKLQLTDEDVTTDDGATLAKLATLTLSGSGTTSGNQSRFFHEGDLGSSTGNTYDLVINASGLKGGFEIDAAGSTDASVGAADATGKLLVSSGYSVLVNVEGVTGEVDFGDIATSSVKARNVTVLADGGASNGAIYAGNVYATDTVNIEAAGRGGVVQFGTIEGSSVTVDLSGSAAGSKFGAITAKSSANLTLNEAGNDTTSTVLVTSSSSSTALTVNLKGSAIADAVTINANGSAQASVTVTGTLDSSDTVVVNAKAGSTAAQTISLAGLTGYKSSILTGVDSTTKADNITGGDGADLIYGGTGPDVLTGGAGADQFHFESDSSPYSSPATITDLKVADAIVWGGGSLTFKADTAGTTTAPAIASGAADFTSITSASSYDTLLEKVDLINGVLSSGDATLFQHGSDTYFFIDDGGTSSGDGIVIKLTGVPLPNETNTLTTGFAADGSTATGLAGVGL